VTNRHDSACDSLTAAGGTVGSAGKALSQRVGVDEVREGALSIPGLELRVALDIDQLEIEPELVLDAANHLERTLAQVAISGVVKSDLGYG
jgi:hypothetical protein